MLSVLATASFLCYAVKRLPHLSQSMLHIRILVNRSYMYFMQRRDRNRCKLKAKVGGAAGLNLAWIELVRLLWGS